MDSDSKDVEMIEKTKKAPKKTKDSAEGNTQVVDDALPKPTIIAGLDLTPLQADIQKVVEFATMAHAGQTRKNSGLPYIVHPMEVLALVADWGVKLNVIAEKDETEQHVHQRILRNVTMWKAVLCHDILEDCKKVSFERLVKVIGSEAANIVYELTFTYDASNPLPEHIQKGMYLNSFGTKSTMALVIKCADAICNTRNFFADNETTDYSTKYWSKRSVLFDRVKDDKRSLEIEALFGIDVIARLKYSRDTTNRLVAKG
jgi:(p)ppGpp synthase/HD superfamily hydrolase